MGDHAPRKAFLQVGQPANLPLKPANGPFQVEPPLGHAEAAQLRAMLESMPAEILRARVLQLAATKPAVQRALGDMLLSADHATGVLVPNVAVCNQCGEEFDPTEEQEEGECEYHSGACAPRLCHRSTAHPGSTVQAS
jgi:hypothetical protein